ALAVFDNFEAVADDQKLLVWLADIRAPVRVAVTTRKLPFGLRGELVEVPEMPREEAKNIFAEAARAAGWDGHGSELVTELCAAVGDLPLAIELLAARAGGIPLNRLLDRVRHDLGVLDGGNDTTRSV